MLERAMLRRREALTGLLAASVVPAAGAEPAKPPLAARPISRLDLPWWRARHEAKLAEKATRPVRLVFLGDSITQQYERTGPAAFQAYRPVWDRFYGDRDALNLGFSGDATSHLLWRIENGEIDGLAPRAGVVLIGANNFGRLHWSADNTFTGIAAVLAATRKRLPRTRLLLLGVLPSDRGPWVAESTMRINAHLAAAYGGGREAWVNFLDITPLFLRDGQIDRTQYADPSLPVPAPCLHPNATGQARMAAAIEPTLAALLQDHDHRMA